MDKNDNRRPTLWAAIVPFFSLAVFVYAVRIFDRWRKSTLSWAEASITATMSAIPEKNDRITIFLLAVWMVGSVASGFARISIALVTLRLTSGSRSKSFLLWAVIVLQALSTVSCEIVEGIWRRDIITSRPRAPAFFL
ncbi:hypothetical protein B0T16DRAFT_423455 [Cercophora newfieldiana]|uniref:Uncharacterized protein n=1 Tax=Cercophora newfieldiana TaxID=92897 RepID=A0AA40CIG8_9PEZI|nr:hypothetical protein B0T16DRAFT_423455 [Cercophora newfieldiana]